jgi:hypothetical protein
LSNLVANVLELLFALLLLSLLLGPWQVLPPDSRAAESPRPSTPFSALLASQVDSSSERALSALETRRRAVMRGRSGPRGHSR